MNNTYINRGFKMTNLYLDNGAHDVFDTTHGTGGAGAEGGTRNVQFGGAGGSGYYGGNWTKLASEVGGNDSASRTWSYGDNLYQTATTDGNNGYIRIWGRRSTQNTAYVLRGVTPTSGFRAGQHTEGLFLDLREWSTDQEVLIRGTVTNSNSTKFLSIYLEQWGDPIYQTGLCGNSDIWKGTTNNSFSFTINENSGQVETWMVGGGLYVFRSGQSGEGEQTSSIFKGGESQCGNGIATGGDFDITVYENQIDIGTPRDNTGDNADLRVRFAVVGERDS